MQMARRRQDLWYLNELVDYIFYTISIFNMYNIIQIFINKKYFIYNIKFDGGIWLFIIL